MKDVSLFIPRFLSVIQPLFPSLPTPYPALLSLAQSLTKHFVSSDCSILTGRHVEPISLAVLILSIESLRKEKVKKELVKTLCDRSGVVQSTVLSRYRELIERFRNGVKELPWGKDVKRGKEYLWVMDVIEYWDSLDDRVHTRVSLLEASRLAEDEMDEKEEEECEDAEVDERGGGGREIERNGVNEAAISLPSYGSSFAVPIPTSSSKVIISPTSSQIVSSSSIDTFSVSTAKSTSVATTSSQTSTTVRIPSSLSNFEVPLPRSSSNVLPSVHFEQTISSSSDLPVTTPVLSTSTSTSTSTVASTSANPSRHSKLVDLPPSYLKSLQSRYIRHVRLARAIRSLSPHLPAASRTIPQFQGDPPFSNAHFSRKRKKGEVTLRYVGVGEKIGGKCLECGDKGHERNLQPRNHKGPEKEKEEDKGEVPFSNEDMVLERLLLSGFTYSDLLDKTEKELTRLSFEVDTSCSTSCLPSVPPISHPPYPSSSISRKRKPLYQHNLDSIALTSLDLSVTEEKEYILNSEEMEVKRFFKKLKVEGVDDDGGGFDECETMETECKKEEGGQKERARTSGNGDEMVEEDEEEDEDEEEEVEGEGGRREFNDEEEEY